MALTDKVSTVHPWEAGNGQLGLSRPNHTQLYHLIYYWKNFKLVIEIPY